MHSNNDNTILYKICIVYDFKQKNFSKLILRYLVWSHKRFNNINRESMEFSVKYYLLWSNFVILLWNKCGENISEVQKILYK